MNSEVNVLFKIKRNRIINMFKFSDFCPTRQRSYKFIFMENDSPNLKHNNQNIFKDNTK